MIDWSEPLLRAIEDTEGVNNFRVATKEEFPTIRFRASREMYVLSQIELLCQKHKVLMLDINRHLGKRPTFQEAAHLETISNSQAVLELLRRFQGGHKSALLCEEFDGSATRLYIELATLIGSANCYRLSVGPLNEMADLICDLVETS